jgi:hypothetical protein
MSSLLVFSRDYRLEIQSVMLVFSIGFVKHCPYNLPLVNSPPSLPSLCEEVYCTVCKGGGSVGS